MDGSYLLYEDPHAEGVKMHLHYGDMTDATNLIRIIQEVQPDGTPRKLLDTARMRALGWAPTIALSDGIARTYAWFCSTNP